LQYPASKLFGSRMKPNPSNSLNTTSIVCLQQRWPFFRHSVRRLRWALCRGLEERFCLGFALTWTSARTLRTGLTELLLPSLSCVMRVIPRSVHSRHSTSSPRLLAPRFTHDSAALVTSNSVHFDAEIARSILRSSTNSLLCSGTIVFPYLSIWPLRTGWRAWNTRTSTVLSPRAASSGWRPDTNIRSVAYSMSTCWLLASGMSRGKYSQVMELWRRLAPALRRALPLRWPGNIKRKTSP
jgi:hypothetical protein